MRFLILAFLTTLAIPVHAANEPPIVAFRAMVTDPTGATRRQETYPLVAAYPDRFLDLAEAPAVQQLLKVHPALKFTEIAPEGTVCGDIPVGLGPSSPVQANSPVDAQAEREAPRSLSLVVFSTAAAAVTIVTTPVGVPRQLPTSEGPGRPSADPIETIRKTVADRLGGTPQAVNLENYGKFDFDVDGVSEMVFVGSVSGSQAPGADQSLLVVAAPGLLALPVYTSGLSPGSAVMGVGDLNGDGRPEIVIRTARSPRDFGLEIHAWRGRAFQRVFERRSFGCY